jgi:ABC-type transporter Mla subunit MlaD
LAEAPGEVPEGERAAINDAIAALREALAGTDYKRIRALSDVLNQASTPLAERMMNRALGAALEGKKLGDV